MQAALDPFGGHPFTTEQRRLLGLLVERVDVHEEALGVRIGLEGLACLAAKLQQESETMAA
jgi:hypothetical protein